MTSAIDDGGSGGGVTPPPAFSLLTFTTLYPNHSLPNQGIFVENRLRHLVATGEVLSRVLAPVPYFPSTNPVFGAWARQAAVPAAEVRDGLSVDHPRYLVIPKLGMHLAPYLLYAAALPAARRLGRGAQAIDAHYLYPDGVAASWLGARLGLPVVLTARGSDVTQIARMERPRRLILRAIAAAAAVITVSRGLADALVALGAPAGKLTVLRNGVDLGMFAPPADDGARAALRATLGMQRPTLISVGGLVARKGHCRMVAAMGALPDWDLLIVGEGPERARLTAQAAALGVGERVRLVGAVPHAALPAYYGAADVSVLASDREGWANVLLESMACGTPAIASPIPGNDEVVAAPEAGRITASNDAPGIVAALRDLVANPSPREATRRYAEGFSWDATSRGQMELFRRVIGG